MMTDIGNFVVLTLRMEVSKNGGTPIAGCFFGGTPSPPKKRTWMIWMMPGGTPNDFGNPHMQNDGSTTATCHRRSCTAP